MTTTITGGTAHGSSGRTTAAQVRAIGGWPSTLNVDAYIETANNYVTRIASCTPLMDAATLELVERWLAAHLVATSSGEGRQVASKSIQSASMSFIQHASGKDLESTPYGLQAMALDETGCLRTIFEGAPTSVWIGTKVT